MDRHAHGSRRVRRRPPADSLDGSLADCPDGTRDGFLRDPFSDSSGLFSDSRAPFSGSRGLFSGSRAAVAATAPPPSARTAAASVPPRAHPPCHVRDTAMNETTETTETTETGDSPR
ncbi:hypothetical protein ACIPRD_26395 [Streptomyces sp. NPDC090108]|uniref:hypothetical protein n=1 Tax=Streptomyces sp. NPDC090108 TaxID=3365947 RepID=UPI0038131FE5